MNLDEIMARIDKQLEELEEKNNEQAQTSLLRDKLNEYEKNGNKETLKAFVQELTYSFKGNKEEALLETVNGKTVLEEILGNGISFPYSLMKIAVQNETLFNIVIKAKYTDSFWSFKEEDFLMKSGEMTVLEHLIINKMFRPYWTKSITKSDIILDMILKYNLKNCFSNLDENQLFKVYKGKLVIEFMFEHNLVDFSVISSIKKHPEIYDYIIKYKKLNLLEYIQEEIMLEKKDEKYIFDLIIENEKKPNVNSLTDEKLVDLIIERKRYDLLSSLSTDKLKNPYMEYETMFEFLLINGVEPTKGINEIAFSRNDKMLFYKIIEKLDRFDCLDGVQEDALVTKFNDKETLLEILLSKGITSTIRTYENEKTLNILYSLERFDELQKCSSKLQKTVLSNGKLLCEELLDRNFNPGIERNDDIEITKKVFEHKRYDLYTKLNINQLFELANINQRFIDIILEESKTNGEIDISEIATGYYDVKENAKIYIAFAEHDLQMFLKVLDKKDLERDNLLKELLKLDKDITINKILSSKVKQDIDIAMMIKFSGFTQDRIKFKSVTKALEEEYLLSNIEEYESLELTPEQESLLNSLKTVMNDGKSDPDIFRAFIASYRHLLATNSPHAYEIYHLMNIKQNSDNFAYLKIDDGAYFSPYDGTVSMDDTNIDTLNHETGHALFRYLTNEEIPPEFDSEMARLRTDSDCLQRTAEYSKKLHAITREVEEQVERDYMQAYDESITEEKKQEIQKYLDTLITEQKQIYLDKGYSEDTLDIIFSKTFTLEEYIKQDRRIKKEEMIDLILRTKHGSFIFIGDYLDGIHVGRLQGGILKDKDGNEIRRTYGHGIYYYSRGNEWALNEMLANYSSIAKSKNPQEDLAMLKEYIGEKLFNIIQNYYQQQILQSKKYINETTQTM